MKQYTNGKEIINATDKAYQVIYKAKGYVPFDVEAEAKKLAEAERLEAEKKAIAEEENKKLEEAKAKEEAEKIEADAKKLADEKEAKAIADAKKEK